MKHLVLTFGYTSFSIPYTEKVAEALPDLLRLSKVTHKTGNVYTVDSSRPEVSIVIAEVENGNN